MTIYDLKQNLSSGYWAMLPENLASFNASVEALVKGDMPMMPDDDDGQPELDEMQEGNTVIITVNGSLVKADGLPENICQLLGIADIDGIYEDLSEAAEDPGVDAIILSFDSPGGQVQGIYELGRLIADVGHSKNLIGYSNGVCASAAYWMASQCNEFYCAPSSVIGSIGVSNKRIDLSKALSKQDIAIEFIASNPRKFWGDPNYPVSPEERAYMQSEVERLNAQFRAEVLSNRSIKAEYMDAQVFDGVTAVSNNYADGNLNGLADLLSLIQER